MQQQAPADEALVHCVEPVDRDRAKIDARSGLHLVADIQRVLVLVQDRDRLAHLGHRVALLAQRVEQPGARREHVGGDGRCAGCEVELVPGLPRDGALHLDAAEVELGAALDGDGDWHRRRGRCRIQRVDQRGVVERPAGDADPHRSAIEAEAVERLAEPRRVLLGAGDQRERPDRRFLPQADQHGGALERRVQLGVPGGRDLDLVGLRVRRARWRPGRREQCDEKQECRPANAARRKGGKLH